jgi:hypothetical protein
MRTTRVLAPPKWCNAASGIERAGFIQPNMLTPDGKAGVQTGELVLITDAGIESLHAIPRGFARI